MKLQLRRSEKVIPVDVWDSGSPRFLDRNSEAERANAKLRYTLKQNSGLERGAVFVSVFFWGKRLGTGN